MKTKKTILAIILIISIIEWGLQAIAYDGNEKYNLIFENIYHFTRLITEFVLITFLYYMERDKLMKAIFFLASFSVSTRIFYRIDKQINGEPMFTNDSVFWVGLLCSLLLIIINSLVKWRLK